MTGPDLRPPAGLRRWPRRVGLALLVMAALAVFLVVIVAPYWLASRLTTGRYVYPDPDAGVTPASLGLGSEDVSFTASDGVGLKGWWIPAAAARGSVVMVHGLNRSRVEMIRKAPFVHGHGWNVLLFDLRHHGASGGDKSSFGWFERLDVKAAAAEARRRSAGPVVVWGVSLGAASGILAAAEDPGVAGVIGDSSYRSLQDTVRHHVGAAGRMRPWLRVLPTSLLAAESLFWIGRKGGFDTAEADVLRAAARLAGRPALFVANSGDWRMPPEIAFELKAAAGPRARVLIVPGRKHAHAYRDGRPAYESAVGDLLDDVLL